ncbi:MAG TPA: SRPBCC domain-containing protein [Candidatus Acidoferrum sp.]|nr:SRPBCC domain-containing protein [Candidatus Acidoferrum sp.]
MMERRDLIGLVKPTRRQLISGLGIAFGGAALHVASAWAGAEEEISHTAESIHQEPVFKANRKRVYEALTDAKQFDRVIHLSAAMKDGMPPNAAPTQISREAGGSFALFGGYVTGRQIELVPNERIVQVWRAGAWDPGAYSIAKFVLVEQGAGTKLVFDHTGFPKGDAEHLAVGWKTNYWEPLETYLG